MVSVFIMTISTMNGAGEAEVILLPCNHSIFYMSMEDLWHVAVAFLSPCG